MTRSDTNRKLYLSSLYLERDNPEFSIYFLILINFYRSIDPQKEFRIRELVNWLLENYHPFINEFMGDKTPKAYRAQSKTNYVVARVNKLIELELIEEAGKAKSERGNSETVVYRFTKYGLTVANLISLINKPNITQTQKIRALDDFAYLCAVKIPVPDSPIFRFFKEVLMISADWDTEFFIMFNMFFIMMSTEALITPLCISIVNPKRTIYLHREVRKMFNHKFDTDSQKVILQLIKSRIEDFLQSMMNTSPELSYGRKQFPIEWGLYKLKHLNNYNQFVGVVFCDKCTNVFPDLFDILINEDVPLANEKTKGFRIEEYFKNKKCSKCNSQIALENTTSDLFNDFESLMLSRDSRKS